jgi:serine protease Do
MNRIVFTFRRSFILSLVPALLLSATPSLYAQRGNKGRNTNPVVAAFGSVVAKPSESVARILCDGTETALGTVISPDGLLVTKASDLKGKIVCKFKDGKEFAARIIGVEEKHDLALLKLETSGLMPIEWRTAKAEVGDFVASASNAALPVAIGIVSVAPRKPNDFELGRSAPSPTSGFLGIQLDNSDENGPIISIVTKGSAADKAGLKPGDIVLSIAGQKMTNAQKLVQTIQRYKVGSSVVLKVRRGEEEKDFKATLEKRPSELFDRGDRMNALGSELSIKRTGFPTILQHDTVIKPKDCGGPLVDLDGKALGINIARAGRTESYAIPAEVVLAILPELKSGRLAPKEDPDEARIAELESALKSLRADLNKGLNDMKALKGDDAELVKKRKGVEDKVNVLRKKVDAKQSELDAVRKDPTKK